MPDKKSMSSSTLLTAACLLLHPSAVSSFAPISPQLKSHQRIPSRGSQLHSNNDPLVDIQVKHEDSDSSLDKKKLLTTENISIERVNMNSGSDLPLPTVSNEKVEISTAELFDAIQADMLSASTASSEQNSEQKAEETAEVSFTSDILSGVDQEKLMDPTEVLKTVIGPAFSNDVSDEPASDLLQRTNDTDENISITESSGEPLLEPLQTSSIVEPLPAPTKQLSVPATGATEVSSEPSVDVPRVRDILRFAIPAIGVWLCSPLLSLIDTSAVGLLSGTSQQAALNPAVAVTDYGALLVAFMYTATTNLIAAAQEKDSKVEGKPLSVKTLVTSLQLSGVVGTALGGALIVFARTLLKSIIGNDAIDPEVFGAAMKYVRIRALGMPAAVIIGSAQSACLGLQDIRSPLYVLLAAAVVNFFGDCIFVGSSSPIFGGAAGAAWATVFSQYAALAMFIKWLTTKAKKPKDDTVNISDAILELTSKSKEGKPRRRRFREALRSFRDESDHIHIPEAFKPLSKLFSKKAKIVEPPKTQKDVVSTRGFLAGKFSAFDLLRLPSLDKAKEFWPYVIPVTTTSAGRVSSYVAMSYVVSSALGTIGMAAQQIIVSLFYCLTPVADSLNLTGQSFIPPIFAKKRSPARTAALKKVFYNFMKTAGIFGMFMAGSALSIPLMTGFFTSDPIVISQVNAVVPYLASCFMLHGFITAGEGVLLGQKDLGFLGKAYAAFFVGVPYFMLRVKKSAVAGLKNADLTSVWQVFLAYQVVRMTMFVLRPIQLQRRAAKKDSIAEASQ